jgi:integrase
MPWYRKEGKVLTPLTEAAFKEGMQRDHFVTHRHRALVILYYYSGVRRMEGLRVTREQFQIGQNYIYFEVGQRLKHSKQTSPLPIPKTAPYVNELEDAIIQTQKGKRVFPYSSRTAYNIVRRAFKYPHWFRLSRITWFFSPHPELDRPAGFSIAEVKNWTGLSILALDYYVGLAQLEGMGKAMNGGEK